VAQLDSRRTQGEQPEYYREYLLILAFVPAAIAAALSAVSERYGVIFWTALVVVASCMIASRKRHCLLGVLAVYALLRLAFGLVLVR
jgi:hypothetical protein